MTFVDKMLSSILILIVGCSYFLLIEGQGSGGTFSACDWRYEENPNLYACSQLPQPEMQDDTEFFRVFKLVVPMQESVCTLRNVKYRCPDFSQYYVAKGYHQHGLAQKYLAAEAFIFGSFYLIGSNTAAVRKGLYGPLFVRSEQTEAGSWAVTKNLPAYHETGAYNVVLRFFVPEIDKNGDPTLQNWLPVQPAKRDFKAAASISVTCEDAEAKCETLPSELDYKFLVNYVPRTTESLTPTIDRALLFNNKFCPELKNDRWGNSAREEYYHKKIINYDFSNECWPKVLFVLYESNPLPHGNTETSKWDQKNGEIRAVIETWTKNLGAWTDGSGRKRLDYAWAFDFNRSKMDGKIKFLQEWQNKITDKQDKIWYQGWNKATGMTLALSLCTCEGGLTRQMNGCSEYVHKVVEFTETNLA